MARLPPSSSAADVGALVPRGIGPISNPQIDLPRIARDPRLTRIIDEALRSLPTHHRIVNQDARRLASLSLTLLRLVRAGLYDAACLILSDRDGGSRGRFREPCEELAFSGFVASLVGRAATYAVLRESRRDTTR